jgi:hypothetical protein
MHDDDGIGWSFFFSFFFFTFPFLFFVNIVICLVYLVTKLFVYETKKKKMIE